MEEAEARAKAKQADGTWLYALSQRSINGTIIVRVVRPMSPSAMTNGGWVEIFDATET